MVPLAKSYWKFSWLGWATGTLLAWSVAGSRFFPLLYGGKAHVAVVGQLLLGAAAVATEAGLLLGVTGGLVVAELRPMRRRPGGVEGVVQPGRDGGRRTRLAISVALGWMLLGGALALGSNVQLSKTVRVVRSVVAEARSCCLTSPTHRSAVPLLGVEWVCEPGKPVVLSGSTGKSAGLASYSVETLEISDDLSSVVTTGLHAELGRTANVPGLRLQVGTAKIHGITGWARPRRLSAAARALLVALCCGGLGLGVVVSGASGRVRDLGFALLPSVAVLLALGWLDAQPNRDPLAYGLLPLLVLFSLLGLWLLRRRRLRDGEPVLGPSHDR